MLQAGFDRGGVGDGSDADHHRFAVGRGAGQERGAIVVGFEDALDDIAAGQRTIAQRRRRGEVDRRQFFGSEIHRNSDVPNVRGAVVSFLLKVG